MRESVATNNGDSNLSFKAFLAELFEEHLRKWIDFRGYLRQRRLILANPRVIGYAAKHRKTWRSPKVFAKQGTLAVATFVLLLNHGFKSAYMATHHGRDLDTPAQKELKEAKSELAAYSTNPNDDDATNGLGEQILRVLEPARIEHLKAELPQLEWAAVFEPKFQEALDWSELFIIACVIYWTGAIFSRLVLIQKGAEYVCDARTAYYYIVTAHTFWFNALGTVVIAVFVDLRTYWPEVLGAGAFYVPVLLPFAFLVFNMVAFGRAARGMRDLGYENIWYNQMEGKVGTANLVASFCCFGVGYVLIALYAAIAATIHQYIVAGTT